MSMLRRPLVRVLLALAAGVVVLLAAGAWLVLKRPLTVERWAAVAGLEKAGLERRAVPTGHGELAVWAGGDGEDTLVLLHGAGDHAGAWAEVAAGLAAEHRLVVPDLPGHGDSAPQEGALPYATILAGVVDLLGSDLVTADGGGPPIVVGNSLGGWLALRVGLERPELVSRLVVVNGGGTPGPVDPGVLLPTDREEAAELFALLGAPGPIPGPVLDDVVGRIEDGETSPLTRFMASDDLEDHALTGRLGDIAVPVDLVWGALDGYLPLAYAESTAAALPAARLTVIEECGHVPPRYCPQRFAATLAEILAAPPPAPAPEPATATGELP